MSTIQVNCADQVLSFASTPVISSGDIGADKVKFTFSNHWDGYAKICTFYQQKGNYFYGMIDENSLGTGLFLLRRFLLTVPFFVRYLRKSK